MKRNVRLAGTTFGFEQQRSLWRFCSLFSPVSAQAHDICPDLAAVAFVAIGRRCTD